MSKLWGGKAAGTGTLASYWVIVANAASLGRGARSKCGKPVVAGEQRQRQLAGPVGAEVVEEAGVAVLDHRERLAVGPLAYERQDELVGDLLAVGPRRVVLLDRGGEVVDQRALAAREHLPGDLQPLPALVTVHGVVAPDRRAELADADLRELGRDLPQVTGRRLGRRVAPVEEGVPDDLGEPAPLRQLADGVGVLERGVDVAGAGETEQVQRPAARLHVVDQLGQHRVVVERARLDRLVDPHDVHVDDAPRAQVQVPDLAVPHLPHRQTDVVLGSSDQRPGPALVDPVEVRGARHPDGVSGLIGALAVAVEDDQDDAGGGAHAETLTFATAS